MALDLEPDVTPSAERLAWVTEHQARDQRRVADTRRPLHGFLRSTVKRTPLLVREIPSFLGLVLYRQPCLHREQMLGVEARLDRDQPLEASQQKTGPGQQDQRDGYLDNHERATYAGPWCPATCRATRVFERRLKIRSRCLERGDETEAHAGEKNEKGGERENGGVDADLTGARQL